MKATQRLACVVAACLLAAGCGTTQARTAPETTEAATRPPLATASTGSSGAGRAIVEMGGSAAQEDNFWELFVRPAGTASWRLATPTGVADNGGIEATGTGRSLVAGFRPSQDLTFSPLAATTDDGASWSPGGPLSPGLVDAPDALASGPGGRLIALTSGGTAELGTSSGTTWTRLASVRAVTGTAAGQACGLTGFTAATFGRSEVPMLAGSCSRPGTAGIFTERGGSWQAAGPAVPRSLAGQDIDVLRLAATGTGVVALLQAGSGAAASLIAAWSQASGWALSAPLRIGTGGLRSMSFGPGTAVAVVLPGGHGETLAGPGSSWRALPRLPASAAALAIGPGGRVDALTAHAERFADWRLGAGGGWGLAQTIHVTIPYGSSG
ncbi:MAG TPA: hypothetical protein VGJ19_06450 [Streptosporangiaceae bacterium]